MPVELITNGGFEDAGSPHFAGWAEVTNGGSISRVGTPVRWGSWSCDCYAESTSGEMNYVQQAIAVVAGEALTLRFWARGGSNIAQYALRDLTHSTDVAALTSVPITTVYQQFPVPFTVPAGCTSIGVRLNSGAAGSHVYYDDVSVERTTTMPTMGADPTDTVWNDGYLYAKQAAGGTYDVPLGGLQDTSLKFAAAFKTMAGPGAFTPIAVRKESETLTGTAKWGKFRLRALPLLIGGSVAYSTATKYTKKNTEEPATGFDLQLKTPASGADMLLSMYNCYCPDLGIPIPGKDFVIPDFGFNVLGKATTGELFELTLPGDQTTS